MTEQPNELYRFLANRMIKQASELASSRQLPKCNGELEDLLEELARAEAANKHQKNH